MINLIIAIVVDAMNEIKEESDKGIIEEVHYSEENTSKEIKELRQELREIKSLLLENRVDGTKKQ